MGRSAGGGGGGGRSSFSGGGGFSSGRSSGGFSGGRSSSGGRSFGSSGSGRGSFSGSSSSSGSSGSGGGFHFFPIFMNSSRPVATTTTTSGGNVDYTGCGALLVVLGIVFVMTMLFGGLSMCSSASGNEAGVSQNLIERQALPASAVTVTGYYTDADGTWISSPYTLEKGLKHFFEKTGVQPYVYILPNGFTTSVSQLTDLAEQHYAELFADEGHFILVFCDDDRGGYNCGYCVGESAKSVMDAQAIDALANYLNRHYNDLSISEEQIFSNAFSDTADHIMTVYKSPLPWVIGGIVVVVLAGVAVVIVRRVLQHKKEEAERQEKILSTPLEKFSDSDADSLASKYED